LNILLFQWTFGAQKFGGEFGYRLYDSNAG